MTIEKANADFTRLTGANGFKATGEQTTTGCDIYAREWSRKVQVAWYGESTDTLEISMWITHGCPTVRVAHNGRPEKTLRAYSSPKRAMNAIAEIVSWAGYSMEVEA